MAHELGHLVLHPDNGPGSKVFEHQANTFASELLMPRAEILDQFPRSLARPVFHDLKRYWGVNLRALIYRAFYLGASSEASYQQANKQLSLWGLPEPGALGPPESPTLLGSAVQLLSEHGVELETVLSAGRFNQHEAQRIITAGSAPYGP